MAIADWGEAHRSTTQQIQTKHTHEADTHEQCKPNTNTPSQEQMNLFAEWLRSDSNGEQLTMISTDEPFEPDLAHEAEGFSMLQPCAFCLVVHTPNSLWCARSVGMPADSPLPEMSGGCGLSKCDNGFCACDMRAYEKEFGARVRSRVELYSSQLEQRDSLMRRAATELVDRAIGTALDAINSDNPCVSAYGGDRRRRQQWRRRGRINVGRWWRLL